MPCLARFQAFLIARPGRVNVEMRGSQLKFTQFQGSAALVNCNVSAQRSENFTYDQEWSKIYTTHF